MKICLLAPANNPHTQKIAYTLQQKGYEISICTFHHATLSGIDVKYFPPLISPFGKLNYILNSRLIANFLSEIKPDILHAHYVSSYGVAGLLTGFHPYIISVWGKDIYDAPNNIILRRLVKKALANADCVLSTSKTMAEQTKKFVTNKEILVTPFGIDLTKFYPCADKKFNKFIIGTARILAPKYGIKYLIKAFAIFLKEVPDAELCIAGEGIQKKELISLSNNLGIINKVRFFGYINPNKIPEFLSHLDVFCMPSIKESESFGVVALEAQACGVPVIASAIGGLHETIIDKKTGYLIPPKDPAAIAEKIQFLYQHHKIHLQMGQSGKAFVKANYNWSNNIKIIENAYHKLSC